MEASVDIAPNPDLKAEDVLPDVYRLKIGPEKRRYHVGITPNGPATFVTLHGVCFPVSSSKYDRAENEFRSEGSVVALTLDQVRKVREELRNRVVRWTEYPADYRDHKLAGTRKSAVIYDVRSTGFEPEQDDEPLVKYVFFKEAPKDFAPPTEQPATFDAIDAAIQAAERSAQDAELEALTDPADRATREKHGALRAAGRTLSEAPDSL